MNILDAIVILDKAVQEGRVDNPSADLPEEIFMFISRTVPLVNVDLLVQDDTGRTLLAWRDDQWAGRGWHVMGGIVRFKETFEERLQKVAQNEINVVHICYDKTPIALNEVILPSHTIRGHFVSILYRCYLPSGFIPNNKGLSEKDVGYLKWHKDCPENLLAIQEMYRFHIRRGGD